MATRPATPAVTFGPADVVAVVGKRGTGKSTCAKALVGRALDKRVRAAVFDPHDEYSRHGRASDQVVLGPLDDRCTVEQLLRARGSQLDDKRLSLAIVPGSEPGDCAEDFDAVARLVAATGGLLFVVEEVGFISDRAADRLNWLATQSRHFGVPLLFVAQRLTQIPKTARTQLTQLVSFRQDNPDDLRALAELAGDTFAADVSRLGRGQSRTWRDTIPAATGRKE